jgi:hypothetical protein
VEVKADNEEGNLATINLLKVHSLMPPKTKQIAESEVTSRATSVDKNEDG